MKMPIIADCLKKTLKTQKTKQSNCQIIWQETVKKLIDELERLGLTAAIGKVCF